MAHLPSEFSTKVLRAFIKRPVQNKYFAHLILDFKRSNHLELKKKHLANAECC
jgi:hypothetical protein